MFHIRYNFFLFIFVVCILLSGHLPASDPISQPSFYDRITNPDRNQKSAFQGKEFKASGGSFDKTLQTGEYVGEKTFNTKNIESKSFADKRNWLGKLLFHEKKLPEKFRSVNRDATKGYVSKDFATKSYSDLEKRSSYTTKEAFSTREIIPKGKTQGALDNDQQLQETIKKGLTVDDVKKLLNKGP